MQGFGLGRTDGLPIVPVPPRKDRVVLVLWNVAKPVSASGSDTNALSFPGFASGNAG